MSAMLRWLLLFAWPAHAATLYVDSANGLDSNSGEISAPIKSLARANELAKRGDTIALAKGQAWFETLELSSQRTYTSYGPPELPPAKIVGSINLTNLHWRALDANRFQASIELPKADVPTQLVQDGQYVLPRARHPNPGQGHWGPSSRYHRIPERSPGTPDAIELEEDQIPPNTQLTGAEIFVRNVDYALHHYDILRQAGTRLAVQQRGPDTPLEIRPGWGYWLENQLWMLDSPGEWHYDRTQKLLTIWMASGDHPKNHNLQLAVLPHGIRGEWASNVVIDNIDVEGTNSDAVWLDNIEDAVIRRVGIRFSGGMGIRITASSNSTIDSVKIEHTRHQGVWMGDFRYGSPRPSKNIHLLNSFVKNTGIHHYAHSAVMLGEGGSAVGNRIENASYIGLHAWRDSNIHGNTLVNTCLHFDDCGAIYTISRGEFQRPKGYALNLRITNNTILNAPGSTDGRPHNGTSTRGIYLDDFSRQVLVENNFIAETDVGIHLHFARDIRLIRNWAIRNRWTQLWLQENAPSEFNCRGLSPCDAANYMHGNHIEGNTFVSTNGQEAIWLQTDFESIDDFAIFQDNVLLSDGPRWIREEQSRRIRFPTQLPRGQTPDNNRYKRITASERDKWQQIREPRDFPK